MKKKKCLQGITSESYQNTQKSNLQWSRSYSGGAGMSIAERNVSI